MKEIKGKVVAPIDAKKGIRGARGFQPKWRLFTNLRCKISRRAMKPREANAGLQILSGWKSIAQYLGKGVRTVQRYERDLRLPVYRPAGKLSSSVIAIKAELDQWAKGSPPQLDNRTMRLRRETNRIGTQFLQVDAEVALTLTGMALKAHSAEKRERQAEAAGRAYETIMRLRRKLNLNQTEREELDARLYRLKSELRQLGKKL